MASTPRRCSMEARTRVESNCSEKGVQLRNGAVPLSAHTIAFTSASARTMQDSHSNEATRLLPVVSVHGCSVAKAMGFKSRADPGFTSFTGCTATWKRILRELAPLYFDVGRYYHEQDPELMKEYMDTVVEKVPWITKYEDCWPIRAYTMKWLDSARWEYNHRRSSKGPTVLAEQNATGTAMLGGVQGANFNQGIVTTRKRYHAIQHARDSVLPTMSLRRSGAPSSKCAPPASSPRSASSTTVDESDAPVDKAVFEPRTGFVRDFLHGLRPSMEDLTPKFVGAGIVNETCLGALAEMPDWEKDKLLRDDMSLKPFQLRVVRVGLAELQA
ncbi:hypothetical protein FOMPIDRAFT_115119 [Fomitopsis schrenkii]|uniref:Uncharacterized protein n=1 Tax=Fomitopsis schrenkii TaxID=2126942 RepID=S8FE22_FOMSC|nr:hypothetical protein FOMPIDRAFT_115119 [Fomitopsis schrenkii]